MRLETKIVKCSYNLGIGQISPASHNKYLEIGLKTISDDNWWLTNIVPDSKSEGGNWKRVKFPKNLRQGYL